MRKTKEEKIVDHVNEVLENSKNATIDQETLLKEYEDLFGHYKKLVRRYSKTIKQSDLMGTSVMQQNESLNDSIQYTINKARNKIMENIQEHRKTKEISSEYLAKVKGYERDLAENTMKIQKLQNKLTFYKKRFGEINDIYDESSLKKEKKEEVININEAQYKNMNIKQVMILETNKSKKNLSIIKISLNSFNQMIETIEESSSLENFLLGIKRYLTNNLNRLYNLKKDYIVFHEQNEVFYIITRENSRSTIEKLMKDVNQKGSIFGFKIVFSQGMTQFKESVDSIDTFLKRCENAWRQAKIGNEPIVIK